MALFNVTLGGITLRPTEVPERLPFGGEQMLAKQTLIGGARVIDAMGQSEAAIGWSGFCFGTDALSRAKAFDAMRIAGAQVTLSWAGLSYLVVVKSFHADFAKIQFIPYQIECEVIANNAAPATAGAAANLDNQVNNDIAVANLLQAKIADGNLSSAWLTFATVAAGIASYVNAPASSLVPMIAAAGVVASAATGVMTATQTTIAAAASIGFAGVVAGSQQNPAALTGQVAAMQNYAAASQMANTMIRIATNLQSARTGGAQQQVIGGDLYAISTVAYGTPNEWPTIAAANGLTDPVLTGKNTTLTVPKSPTGADGVLTL
jgi:hypothetical protein